MMHADKALITRLSSSLISEGFAQNTSGKPRVYSLELTPKGLDALGIIEREQTEAWKLLTSDITPEERRAIDSAVEKIAAAAERLGGGNCG